jgi:hypothetical protein
MTCHSEACALLRRAIADEDRAEGLRTSQRTSTPFLTHDMRWDLVREAERLLSGSEDAD